MAPLTQWNRLIRYVSAKDGSIRYGEPVVSDNGADIDNLTSKGLLKVSELLGPLTWEDVPILRCVGINYTSHMREIGFDNPENPTMFFKPSYTITDTGKPVPIPKLGQSCLDYEGELTIVIGREAKNVSEDDALDYVAGYVCSNDVSCRDWQMEKNKAGYEPQWCFSKSFDKYAPLGPQIVSTKILGDAKGLSITTKVNREVRQKSNTSDLYFGVRKLVSFLSTGQTIPAGSLIMTGTPGGVALGMKPSKHLKDGDEVVVELEGIGKARNVMEFE